MGCRNTSISWPVGLSSTSSMRCRLAEGSSLMTVSSAMSVAGTVNTECSATVSYCNVTLCVLHDITHYNLFMVVLVLNILINTIKRPGKPGHAISFSISISQFHPFYRPNFSNTYPCNIYSNFLFPRQIFTKVLNIHVLKSNT